MMGAEEAGRPFLPEPVALASDVEHVAVVQQSVEDRRGDHRVAQELAHSPKPLFDVRMMLPRS